MSTRRICFTKNKYEESDIDALLAEERFSYGIFGLEVGEQGTPHLQGYAEFHKKTKFATIAKKYKMHCEVLEELKRRLWITVRRMETGERVENQDVMQK